MITTNESTRTVVRVGPIERDRIFSWLGLAFPVAVSLVLNMWNLAQNGYSFSDATLQDCPTSAAEAAAS